MFDISNPDWGSIVFTICGAAVIITAIICNTRTRISQQKYDYKQDVAPEQFSYKLQKHEQKIRLTAELYGRDGGSERIQVKPEDHPSSGT